MRERERNNSVQFSRNLDIYPSRGFLIKCNYTKKKKERERRCPINRKCFESSPKHSPPLLVHGKIILHEIGPWCPKGWGLLMYKA